jgi:rhodanese-related sulfurtransferase
MPVMKRTLLLVAIAAALVFGCTPGGGSKSSAGAGMETTQDQAAPAPAPIGAKEAATLVEQGQAVLVDVREERELMSGMAAPAIWMPTSIIGADGPEWRSWVASQPKDRELIFYCASGGRAQYAATELARQGYRTANLGGFSAWRDAGLPVRTPEHPEVGK